MLINDLFRILKERENENSDDVRRRSNSHLMFDQRFGLHNSITSTHHDSNMPIERTEMVTAIITNNIATVRKLIENQEALNIVDKDGRSYLHLSAYFNKCEITQLLIKAGLKVDCRDHSFLAPLHSACSNNSADVVKLLFEHGADLNARDVNWLTPLHISAAENSLDCLNHLNRNPVYLNVPDKKGSTALHYSAAKGYYEFSENLLKNGADPKLQDNNGRCSLHYAVIKGDDRVVQLILDQDVDINLKDNHGLTALHVACSLANHECVALLISRGADVNLIDNDGNTPLHLVSLSNLPRFIHANIVAKMLIDNGADLESRNNLQMTVLHLARNDGPIVEAYRRLKLDFDCRDYMNRTPLMISCLNDNSSFCEILLENGANIRARDKFNRIPLHYAIEYSESKFVNLFIDNDPSIIGLVDDNNCNSLHYAARLGFSNVWNALIKDYSNFDAKDNFGRTVHFYAAHCCKILKTCLPIPTTLDTYNRNILFYTLTENRSLSVTSLEFILNIQNLKLDINQRDIYGRTVLHYAYLLHMHLHVEVLLRFLASPYIEDEKGLMPIHYLLIDDNNEALCNLINERLIDLNQIRYRVCLMQFAAYHGAFECLNTLINNNYNYHSSLTRSLEYACWSGHVECVELLLGKMVKTDSISDLYDSCALNIALMRSHHDCFGLLMVNLERIDIRDEFGRTAMMFALSNCKEKNYCIDKLLSRSDCDLNAVDDEHRNVLFYSVYSDNIEMVKFFLKSGVNALQKCLNGQTILHLSALLGNKQVFSILIENLKQNNISYDQLLDNDGFNPLHYACFKGNIEIIKIIIDTYPEKNHSVRSSKGINYLHLASYSSDEDCVKLILDQFGQKVIDHLDSNRRNALHYLCMSKVPSSAVQSTNSIQLNQSNPASISRLTLNESTSDHHVEINQKQLASYKLLINNQIDINCKDKFGKTPLMIALQNDGCRLSLCLIDEPTIDLAIKDQNDCTSLIYACKFKNELAGQKMIRKDSSLVNLADNNGRTALHLAASNGLFDLTKCLLSAGSSCFVQDSYNFTPALACAKDSDVADCLDLIIEVMIFEKSQNDTNVSSLVDKNSIRCSSPILETRKSLILSHRSRRSELNSSFDDDLSKQLRKS